MYTRNRPLFVSHQALVDDLVKTGGQTLSQPQDVHWGTWEMWSGCSQQCSRGFRSRKRNCSNAQGRTNPNACVGSPVEYQDCNLKPCPGKLDLRDMMTTCLLQVAEVRPFLVCSSQWSLVLLVCLVPVLSQLWERTLSADSYMQQPSPRKRRGHLYRPTY